MIRETSNTRGKNFADSLEEIDIKHTISEQEDSKRKINVINTGAVEKLVGGVDGEENSDAISLSI